MQDVKINCKKCGVSNSVPRSNLAAYAGKTVSLNCSACTGTIMLQIPIGFKAQVELTETEHEGVTKPVEGKIAYLRAESGQSYKLVEGDNYIGRLSPNQASFFPDFALKTEDLYISKKHCMVSVRRNRTGGYDYVLRDAGSANGTYFKCHDDAEPLGEHDAIALQHGDWIWIGHTRLDFELI